MEHRILLSKHKTLEKLGTEKIYQNSFTANASYHETENKILKQYGCKQFLQTSLHPYKSESNELRTIESKKKRSLQKLQRSNPSTNKKKRGLNHCDDDRKHSGSTLNQN